jgi:protein SCO1/2
MNARMQTTRRPAALRRGGAVAGALLGLAAMAAPAGPAAPQVAPTAAPSTAPSAAAAGAARYLAGLALVDQHGRSVDLYRDLIAGRTVVIHSFFAGCTSSCPVAMNTLKLAQSRLGGRLGRDVRFISITVNPVHDTPAALQAYAARIGALPGWVFLTGSEAQVDAALRRIGQQAGDPAAHTDLMVVGNARTGLWTKLHGAMGSAAVADLIVGVADDAGR